MTLMQMKRIPSMKITLLSMGIIIKLQLKIAGVTVLFIDLNNFKNNLKILEKCRKRSKVFALIVNWLEDANIDVQVDYLRNTK